jgi:hypothetical protein
VSALLDRLFGRSRGERVLFATSKAPYQDTEHAVGRTIPWEGEVYRITRWIEIAPVSLPRGGTTRRWEIWGRPLSEGEIQKELESATQSILEADDPKDPRV